MRNDHLLTLRVLYRVHKNGGALLRNEITCSLMNRYRKNQRTELLNRLVKDGYLECRRVQQVEKAGRPGELYLLTSAGKNKIDSEYSTHFLEPRNGATVSG